MVPQVATFPDPLTILAHLSRPRIFVIILVAWLLLGGLMMWFLRPINSVPNMPKAGISLQMAGSEGTARNVLKKWGESGQLRVAYTIGLDALYIVLYVGLLILGCRMAADGFAAAGQTTLARLGLLLAWVGVVAGLFDWMENAGQMQMLTGHLSSGWPAIVRICSWVKFILSGAGGVYVLAAIGILRSRFFT